ncbi:NADPH-dependent F420 reductase [Paenibacillus sp. FSL R10-2736]|uniref:NADPH-dependent F420 reductase n=1 Tax=Paenibacillus sp. FSL R10-2736 TaxID=2954692 RepID=UPI0030FB5DBC
MRIGILGAGHTGEALGRGLIQAGHVCFISSREPEHSRHLEWMEETGAKGHVGTFNQAAQYGELVILALPWAGMKDVLDTLDPEHLNNKTVIDISNAVHFDRGPKLIHNDTSAGESVQSWLPASRVVKTLNTVNAARMVHPQFTEGVPVMFVSGNDTGAKAQTVKLLHELGWSQVIDLGDIWHSRLQESIMLACVISESRLDASGAAFSLLKR